MELKSFKNVLLGFVLLFYACNSDDPQPSNCDSPPTITATTTVTSSCTATDGTITAVGTGGEGSLEYSIDGTTFQTSGEFTALAAKAYTVTVRDANGCTSEVEAIVNPSGTDLAFNVATTKDNGCLSNNGTIEITATGGQTPYEYDIGNGFVSATAFSGLEVGAYTVIVKDASGCSISKSANIERGDTGTSFVGQIKSIIDTNCAISGCHDGTLGADRNFTILTNIQAKAAQVKSRTQSRDMPRGGGSLTQNQIDLIACWVDDGAKNN
jgi:hypothetical protein